MTETPVVASGDPSHRTDGGKPDGGEAGGGPAGGGGGAGRGERKAAMVSDLLVVLCGDQRATPVVNTGSLST